MSGDAVSDDLIATVDEIEENEAGERLAVLVFDDGQQLVVPLDRLPDGTRDGSVLRLRFRLDRRAERRLRDEIRDLQRRLFGPEE